MSQLARTNRHLLNIISFGVFQEYYLSHAPFEGSSEQAVNQIGNIAIGLQFAVMPFVIMFMRRWPHLVSKVSWGCLVIGCFSLFMSSFATKVRTRQLKDHLRLANTSLIGLAPHLLTRIYDWLDWRDHVCAYRRIRTFLSKLYRGTRFLYNSTTKVNEWFVLRRGLAVSIIFVGCACLSEKSQGLMHSSR